MTIGEKMCREQGIATSCHRTDQENNSIIRAILNQYLAGADMWCSLRNVDDWFRLDEMPMDFNAFRYRVEKLVEED